MGDRSQIARPGAVLAVLSLAAFMASLDLFIVNVAFDDIGRSFRGSSLSDLSWVLNAYAIVYAALLVPLGRLADRYSRKAGFLGGLALFVLASAACAASSGLWMLVAFRALQAAGAAALTPASLGLLLSAFPPEARGRAVRIWAATGALAAAAGPVVGGLLVEASWRWVFIVNVPVGLVAIVVAARIVRDSRDPAVSRMPDLAGAALLTIAIAALSLGLVRGSDWGWTSVATIGCFVAAVVGTGAFWVSSERHHSPIVEPALLRVRSFVWSNVTAVAFTAGFAANLLTAILWMQQVWHYSALGAGLGFAPGPLMVPIFAAVGGVLIPRIGIGRVAALGCVLFGAGLVIILLSVGQQPDWVGEILPALIVTGAGVGLALPTILAAATAELPANRAATGSAVVNMSRQIGAVLGVSVLVAILGNPASYGQAHAAFQHAWIMCAAFSLLGAVTAPGMTPRAVRSATAEAPAVPEQAAVPVRAADPV